MFLHHVNRVASLVLVERHFADFCILIKNAPAQHERERSLYTAIFWVVRLIENALPFCSL